MYLLSEQAYPPAPYDMFRSLNRLLAMPLDGLDGPFNSFCSGELMTNVHEDDEAYYVEMEVPGVKPEEVDVSLIGTELTVKIEHEESKDEKSKDDKRYLRRERCSESMVRTINLPMESAPKDVEANIKNGILCVKLRKPEPVQVKKIAVDVKK